MQGIGKVFYNAYNIYTQTTSHIEIPYTPFLRSWGNTSTPDKAKVAQYFISPKGSFEDASGLE